MATLIPSSQPTGVEGYEDMFKEITRKLYGDETGHGLHTLGTPIAHVVTGGPTTAPEGGERSFTTLMTDRSLIEYEHTGSDNNTNNQFKPEDHLTTAFGLAALMQNGFPPPGTILNPHTFSSSTTTATTKPNSVTTTTDDNRWQGSDDCLPWNTNKIAANYNPPQKPFKPKRELIIPDASSPANSNSNHQIEQKITTNGTNTGVNNTQINTISKRYNCQNCPYSTDRRDLFTRHENIHKDEKPFHCYVCTKQFNRADHVKKHFLRMHRELVYDINKTRRNPTNSNKSFFPTNQQQQQQQQIQAGSAITIPTNNTFQQQQHQQQQQNNLQTQQSVINSVVNQESNNNNNNNSNNNNNQHQQTINQIKIEKTGNEKTIKKKGEKRFVCCYCPWSGADSWGLKRHLNTHTKPYVCMLCDYKAARSERLATHVFKVHNKKACNKCNFLADDQVQFVAHQNEAHPHDSRPPRSSTGGSSNVLRTIGNSFIPNTQLNNIQNTTTAGHVFGSTNNTISTNAGSTSATTNNSIYNNTTINNTILSDVGNQHVTTSWSSNRGNSSGSQKRGAERLFQYMEADGSDPEDYARQMQMVALSRNTASVAQDFHNAGGGYNKTQSFEHKKFINNNKSSIELLIKNNEQQQEEQQLYQQYIIGSGNNLLINQTTSNNYNNSSPATSNFVNNNNNNNNSNINTNNNTNSNNNTNNSNNNIINNNNNNNVSNNNNNNNNNSNNSIINTTIKRRRRSSNNDKENTIIIKKPHIDLAGIERHMKDVITRLYMDPFSLTLATSLEQLKVNSGLTTTTTTTINNTTGTTTIETQTPDILNVETNELSPKDNKKHSTLFSFDNFTSIHDYLKNNKELTISIEPNKNQNELNTNNYNNYNNNNNNNYEQIIELKNSEKRNRKQAQPRKIEQQTESITLTNIRDKHLIRLVSRKKFCKLCKNNVTNTVMPYHTKISLLLHTIWRHSSKKHCCVICKEKFNQKYKLIIHTKLQHKKK